MSAADTYELTIDQARDWTWGIQWLVGKTERTAVPKPGIEDYTILMGFKENYSDLTPLVLLTAGDGITVTADGWIRFHMLAAVCETLPAKRLKFEVVAISPALAVPPNFQSSLAKGTAIIVPKVV